LGVSYHRPAAATQSAGSSSTIGREWQVNPVLRLGEEEYVRELLAGLDAFPATGAVHIPIHQLPSRLADVPEGEVWVHCEARCTC
jgi:hypothetical protein